MQRHKLFNDYKLNIDWMQRHNSMQVKFKFQRVAKEQNTTPMNCNITEMDPSQLCNNSMTLRSVLLLHESMLT